LGISFREIVVTSRPEKTNRTELFVLVTVKPGYIQEFVVKTRVARDTARSLEAECLLYDLYQHERNPERFLLHEAYVFPNGETAHRVTPHYISWRDEVAQMMESPRRRIQALPPGFRRVS
jgi:quinol monooxygenase YgiN